MAAILGISAFYHDSAAALIRDGEIIAAAQEERFTRIKHDSDFPFNAVKYCLEEAGIRGCGLDGVAFYDKPVTKFSRILETYFGVAPKGVQSFVMAIPLWLKQKLWIPMQIESALKRLGCDWGSPSRHGGGVAGGGADCRMGGRIRQRCGTVSGGI